MVSNIVYFHPYLGKVSILTIFFLGWNHQPETNMTMKNHLTSFMVDYSKNVFHPELPWLAGTSTMNEDVLFLLEIWNFPASHVSEQLMWNSFRRVVFFRVHFSRSWCFWNRETEMLGMYSHFYQNPLNTLGLFPYQLVDIEIKCIETLGICNAPSWYWDSFHVNWYWIFFLYQWYDVLR